MVSLLLTKSWDEYETRWPTRITRNVLKQDRRRRNALNKSILKLLITWSKRRQLLCDFSTIRLSVTWRIAGEIEFPSLFYWVLFRDISQKLPIYLIPEFLKSLVICMKLGQRGYFFISFIYSFETLIKYFIFQVFPVASAVIRRRQERPDWRIFGNSRAYNNVCRLSSKFLFIICFI